MLCRPSHPHTLDPNIIQQHRRCVPGLIVIPPMWTPLGHMAVCLSSSRAAVLPERGEQ